MQALFDWQHHLALLCFLSMTVGFMELRFSGNAVLSLVASQIEKCNAINFKKESLIWYRECIARPKSHLMTLTEASNAALRLSFHPNANAILQIPIAPYPCRSAIHHLVKSPTSITANQNHPASPYTAVYSS
jgi:hypothetical protein